MTNPPKLKKDLLGLYGTLTVICLMATVYGLRANDASPELVVGVYTASAAAAVAVFKP